MTTTTLDRHSRLIEQFLKGAITEEEATELLALISKEPNLRSLLVRSWSVDLLLREKFAMEKEVRSVSPLDIMDAEIESAIMSGRFDDLDRYVEIQRKANPIVVPQAPAPEPKPALYHRVVDSLRGVLLPRENEPLSESVVPFVWCVCGLFLVLSVVLIVIQFTVNREEKEPLPVVARITDMIDATWQHGQDDYKAGMELTSDEIALQSGEVKLLFGSGAEVILQGPCSFMPIDASHAVCRQGRLSAHLPKRAKGMEVSTPFGTVIDRSTAFTLDVTKQGHDVQCVEGHIDVKDTAGVLNRLTPGMALRLSSLGPPQTISFDPKSYIVPDHFEQRVLSRDRALLAGKREEQKQLDATQGLILRYDCSERQKQLINHASYGQNIVGPGRLFGADWSSGELRETHSLRIKKTTDRVEFDVSGTMTSMTLVARVKINKLENQANVLLASNDFMLAPGTFLWQINRDGRIQLQITPEESTESDRGRMSYDTLPVVTNRMLGTWITFAVIIDAESKVIRHFMDGRLIKSCTWDKTVPIRPGTCTLGNFTSARASAGKRNFNGCFSEVRIYDRLDTFQSDRVTKTQRKQGEQDESNN
ncbi:MAG: LamG-like jellyroll fold domain-containing protein [Planctomycetia bacterium]|nr:LamG-like jellyroll fold domain-containing protein [Planctomycetia bacterium]